MISLKYFLTVITVILNFHNGLCKWQVWDKDLEWWQTTTLYQIYPRSFQDSDGDGIGDLKGIESRLDHFVETGIKAIWLSPIFKSPMADLGYDIASFVEIDPIFGTLDDFKSLVKAVKERGMYILMDLVPNHTSDEHEWFQKSIEGIAPYKDYYIWKDGNVLANGTIVEPNNWLSLFSGKGWTWNDKRKQYYYHQFNVKQPDLDLRNVNVQQEFRDAIKFWFDLGVDGFRVDAVKHFMEDPEFHNELCLPKYGDKCDKYTEMNHNYTTDWPTTYDMIIAWRKYMDEYKENSTDKRTRVMFTEAYSSIPYTMDYYGNETSPGAQFPFNFFLVGWPKHESNATDYVIMINAWYDNMPEGRWPNWVAGNHDNHRVASRMGNEMVDAFFMLGMLLPGTGVTYQGEEIGQPDTPVRPDQIRDPNNNGNGGNDVRDPQRGPFLWDDSENAGFSSAKIPWEPVHPSYWEINLEAQKKAKKSHYKVYKQITELRKTNTIQRGSLNVYTISDWVFAFTRKLSGNETYIVVINCGSEREVITLGQHLPSLPSNLSIVLSSINSGYEDGELIDTKVFAHNKTKPLILRPEASVVLSTYAYQPPAPNTEPPPNSNSTTSSPNSTKNASPSSMLVQNRYYSLAIVFAPIAIFFLLLS